MAKFPMDDHKHHQIGGKTHTHTYTSPNAFFHDNLHLHSHGRIV